MRVEEVCLKGDFFLREIRHQHPGGMLEGLYVVDAQKTFVVGNHAVLNARRSMGILEERKTLWEIIGKGT